MVRGTATGRLPLAAAVPAGSALGAPARARCAHVLADVDRVLPDLGMPQRREGLVVEIIGEFDEAEVVADADVAEITPREVIEKGLKVADATAFSLCMDNDMPILVFNLLTEGNIKRAVNGEQIGTLVQSKED